MGRTSVEFTFALLQKIIFPH